MKTLTVFTILQFLLFALLSFWSYTLTDPNLVLTSWQPYWNVQHMLWQLPASTKSVTYVVLISLCIVNYFWLYFRLMKEQFVPVFQTLMLAFFISSAPLLFSYNALSHDVFNYIFNARMVLKYQADPHVQVALNFSPDDWLRFMHNVHTPAPYWYGWTALSLPPYILGGGKFVITWLLFRVWSYLGLILLILGIQRLVQNSKGKSVNLGLLLFMFNPLVLIELIMNSHNDGWMMALAVWSFALIVGKGKVKTQNIVLSFVLLLSSVSTKYITAVLFPVWIYVLLEKSVSLTKLSDKLLKTLQLNVFDVSALLLFVPLLTTRSQWFHPWYLVWSLSFLPVMKNTWLRKGLIVLSVTSLYRYLPWMWNGAFEFNEMILMQQRMVTWVPLVFALLYFFLQKTQKKSSI